MHEIVDKFASLVGMKEYLKKEPGELSGGQKQRVAYVIHQFDCLDSTLTSLDEVLSEVEDNQQIKFDGSKLI